MEKTRYYVAIDLKSFYASVECADRGLDPLSTNLVVADAQRTEKTICLAVSPSLKAYGIPGRPRLFEVVQRVAEVNEQRRRDAKVCKLLEKSWDANVLLNDKKVAVDYLVAKPRMARYMEVSTKIYQIYLRYIAPEDIHVYSVDEVFIDVTDYLQVYHTTPFELAMRLIKEVLAQTNITATAGIGTNLYLAKIAMDIKAKKSKADAYGVRIAELTQQSYREELWDHKPITDFWRVGPGIAKSLAKYGIFTMGDICRCSLESEDFLYRLFGVNAELLIDHAWGYEPCTIDLIKKYRPQTSSLSSGQVLQHPYTFEKAKLVTKEMTDLLVLDLVDKGLVTDQLVLHIGYDIECLTDPMIEKNYKGEIQTDRYGRKVPKHAHGTKNLPMRTASTKLIVDAMMQLYDEIVDRNLLIRRINVVACKVVSEHAPVKEETFEQLSLFCDYEEELKKKEKLEKDLKREHEVQKAVLSIKKKFGKNAILKGMNLEDGATAKDRNSQIGGHKA